MRHREIDIEKFKQWLLNHGAEILPCTNEYEAIRFKGREVGVLYKSGKTNNEFTSFAIRAFKLKKPWTYGRAYRTGRQGSYKKEKLMLLKRDGDKCFYCGKRLLDDITLEHLTSLASGGSNKLGNMVLAHESCNQEAGNLSVYQKVELAIKKRKRK